MEGGRREQGREGVKNKQQGERVSLTDSVRTAAVILAASSSAAPPAEGLTMGASRWTAEVTSITCGRCGSHQPCHHRDRSSQRPELLCNPSAD